MPEVVGYQKRRAPTRKLLIYDTSTRVLVRPISLDMAEVGGSIKCDYRSILHQAPVGRSPLGRNSLKPVSGNPPGPTKS